MKTSILIASLICGSVATAIGQPFGTELVSVSTAGNQGNAQSRGGVASADGRFIAFFSTATNLVPDDTNGAGDVFVRDRRSSTTERVSINSAGVEGNGFSASPSISSDGRYVAFASSATNLVAFDFNDAQDVFVHDRATRTTIAVSITNTREQGNGDSHENSISADGRIVAFRSFASNFIDGDLNGTSDIFVHDISLRTTDIVDVDNDGTLFAGSTAPTLSGNGRFVAFASGNGPPSQVFVRDRIDRVTRNASTSISGEPANHSSQSPAISADGQLVTFLSYGTNLVAGDRNGLPDIFVARTDGTTIRRVSVPTGGGESNGQSLYTALSGNGQVVAFYSEASNLVDDDTNDVGDIFVYDVERAVLARVSLSAEGEQANGRSLPVSLSADASMAVFSSEATNLVLEDTNGDWDVFAVSLVAPTRTPTSTRTAIGAMTPTPTPTVQPTVPPAFECVGDCDVDRIVTVDEIVAMVAVALGSRSVDACLAGDSDDDGRITVDEVLRATRHALEGCQT